MTHDTQIRQLLALARVLVARGLHVGMSDARPALAVPVDAVDTPLYVSVDGDSFTWLTVSHSADDPAGAGDRIASLFPGRVEPKA